MKQTLFAWLASIFSSRKQTQVVGNNSVGIQAGGSARVTGGNSIARGGASGDGGPGQVVITDDDGKIIFDSWNTEDIKRVKHNAAYIEAQATLEARTEELVKIKSQAELDYEYLKAKITAGKELVVMSENRYIDLIKLAFVNDEVDEWINKVESVVIFLPDVKGIGIVKC